MPVTSKIYPELGLLKLDYTGHVTLADISAAYREFLDSPDRSKVKSTLSDLTDLEELRAFYDGSAMIASMVVSDSESLAEPWDIAIVSSNLKHYALLSDYASNITKTSSLRCKILQDIPAALDWLGLDPNAVRAAVPQHKTPSTSV